MKKSLLILTGHSQGLGRAILDNYLAKENFQILAISRSKLDLDRPNLTEVSLDLGELDVLESRMEELLPDGDYEQVILINNAGWIGEIKPIGSLMVKKLRSQVNVNLLAPMYLTNAFIAKYKAYQGKKIICNVSSGASHKPMQGWGGYCSTKAAIAMFTKVAAKENSDAEFRFFSVAPGIVDTQMQDEIRQASALDFPEIERFKSYKSNGDLSSPEQVASKISHMLENEHQFTEVIQDVRDFELP
ncbi:SDR family NAD(P)-dependent oxidoreductase [Algoriphagus halophytocola]|uniref:SDR family NAD(P)-dependent oxidoreductase n=1 Tax=Algoriphagus halophytocola TaxID=2991499 RepID=A0ABY6ML44_9BACT|nr:MULTISPECIES: SDR family NAD(P)-dependent oxidoreductase [unclassified Algoriphagus]UZD24480.1 SDR family NAD(P)-dependent oxidoreductase [Algoriphagus sp. TR-M5]WBL41844.1 SDR family NAD(P)-dependent oxidoreductase [Algoriphagus sp. TR-M9]